MVSASDLHGLIGMMPAFTTGPKTRSTLARWSAAWTGQSGTV